MTSEGARHRLPEHLNPDVISIEPLQPGDDSVVSDLLLLFNEAYNPPPWGETAEENQRTISDMVRDAAGWRAVVARSGSRIVGVAQGSYGAVLKGDLERLDPNAAADLGEPLFEFHQLVVSHSVRGQGIGSQLHDKLMAELGHDAVLETHPDAASALRLYRARGWREHGTFEVVPGFDRTIMTFGKGS